MKLPIRLYGDPILRKKCKKIDTSFPNLNNLLHDMFETMYSANGVGLAAPQAGMNIRLFIIDSSLMLNDEDFKNIKDKNQFKKVFINPQIIRKEGVKLKLIEGCLSIPNIRECIPRSDTIILEYYDEHFNYKIEQFSDIQGRIIQHEYDHIEGKLFIDYLSVFKKKLLEKKLKNISRGIVYTEYDIKKP